MSESQPQSPIARKVDALNRGRLEQHPVWQEATTKGFAHIQPQQVFEFFADLFGINRAAVLLLADEVDKLAARTNPEG